MDAVFTLQWAELVVAQKLQKLLPRKKGYSILLPSSRQEKGFDLAVLHRTVSGKTKTWTIQVKASRTYLGDPPRRKTTVRYRFYTWFNRFEVPKEADWIILFGMYAPDISRTKRVTAKWYQDCSLIFKQDELKEFMKDCKTKTGKLDNMFSFGFNNMSKIILTRGDQKRSGRHYESYLLDRRISTLINT